VGPGYPRSCGLDYKSGFHHKAHESRILTPCTVPWKRKGFCEEMDPPVELSNLRRFAKSWNECKVCSCIRKWKGSKRHASPRKECSNLYPIHYGSISEDRTSKVHFKANHPSRNIDHPYPIVAHIWYLLFLSVVTLILLIPLPLVATL